jgi:hypothetical protein
VHLSPEVMVNFPVEVFASHGFGYVSAEMLGLSPELAADLIRWLRWWQERVGPGDDDEEGDDEVEEAADEWRRWTDDGTRLLRRLKDELGTGFDIDWV